MILAKILRCQVLLPSPNNKLLEKASFSTWHLVSRLGKIINLSSEFLQTIGVAQCMHKNGKSDLLHPFTKCVTF